MGWTFCVLEIVGLGRGFGAGRVQLAPIGGLGCCLF